MNKANVKAVVVFDRRASSWFSEKIVDDCSIDCYLMDAEEFLLDIEIFDRVLDIRREKQALDAVLLDAALPSAFLMKMVMRVRDKMPGLPVLLLPQFDAVSGKTASFEKQMCATLPQANVGTLVKTVRYAHNRQRLQRKLLRLALKDDLTGLYNRRGFIALAKQHLWLARSMKQNLLLFFADLDGLKQINDQFGHHTGDQALTLAAAGLKRTFRKSDIIARLGGDEFVALVTEEPERSSATICQRLHDSLAKYAAKECRYSLSLSVGIARFDPEAPVSLSDLMRLADAALYKQKRQQRSVSLAGPLAGITATASKKQPRREIDVTRLSKRRLDGNAGIHGTSKSWAAVPQLELDVPAVPP